LSYSAYLPGCLNSNAGDEVCADDRLRYTVRQTFIGSYNSNEVEVRFILIDDPNCFSRDSS